MATERDDILEALNEGRSAIDELGLRRFYVSVRRRRWYSGTIAGSVTAWAPGPKGVGYPVDTETRLLPSPRCVEGTRQHAGSGGTFVGDTFKLAKITPRREPDIGVEIGDLLLAAETSSDEVHVMVEARSGTPHHVYEGTPRVLAPGPYDAATALPCLNALRAAFVAHVAAGPVGTDPGAHLLAGTVATLPPVATDTATALTLANALRTAYIAHRADLTLHVSVDKTPLAALAATDAQTLCVLVHGLLATFNAHVASGPLSECTVLDQSGASFQFTLTVGVTRRTP